MPTRKAKAAPRGRPRKNPDALRSVTVRVLTTAEQAEELRAAAAAAGASTSTWLLQVGLQAARRARRG